MDELQAEFDEVARETDDLTLLQMLRAYPGQLDPSVGGSQAPLIVACHSGNMKLFKRLMAYPNVIPVTKAVQMALDYNQDRILMALLRDPRTPLEPFEAAHWSGYLLWQLWGLPISLLQACSSDDSASLAAHDLSRLRYKQMDMLMARSTEHPLIIQMLKRAQLQMFGVPADPWSLYFIGRLPSEMSTCRVRAMLLARHATSLAISPLFPSELVDEIALHQKPKVKRIPHMLPSVSLAIRSGFLYKGLELTHNVHPLIGTLSYAPCLILTCSLLQYLITTHVHQIAMKSDPFYLVLADIAILFYLIVCTISIFEKSAYEAIMVPVALVGIMLVSIYVLKRFNRD